MNEEADFGKKNLEVFVGVRIFQDIIEEADENVRRYPDIYENRSHYVRAALARLNRFHEGERKNAEKK